MDGIGFERMVTFSIFPIIYTIYNAFTNYGDGHLISQAQAIEQIQAQTYLPETGKALSMDSLSFRVKRVFAVAERR